MEMRLDDAHRPSVATVTGRYLPLWKASGARADVIRPHSPKLQSNLPRMSRSRVTPAPDLVPARSGQTRK